MICTLCNDEAVIGGVFTPDRPVEWGAPEGKQRFFVYALCQNCIDKGNSAEKIESYIVSGLKNLFPERS